MEADITPGLFFSIFDREFKKKLEERAGQLGLTAVQLRVLGELSRMEALGAEEINQRDLENALLLTHPTMTEIMKRLEKKHAVTCSPSLHDKRYKKINCTPPYLNIHEELREMDWEIFRELSRGIPEEELRSFLSASEKMLRNISK
jgi:DNA-binding MarR family transcriptional regulator